MLVEFSRSLRKHLETRYREKRYMIEPLMLEFDMAVSQTLLNMKEARELMLNETSKKR